MRQLWRFWCLALVSVILWSYWWAPAILHAQPATPATVHGKVLGKDGSPKQFARVQFEGPGNYVALTDASGAFAIKDMPAGQYRVTVKQGDNVQMFSLAVGSSPLTCTVKW